MSLTAWVEQVFTDPERRAKALHWLWLASLGMVALGYAVIVQHYAGKLDFRVP